MIIATSVNNDDDEDEDEEEEDAHRRKRQRQQQDGRQKKKRRLLHHLEQPSLKLKTSSVMNERRENTHYRRLDSTKSFQPANQRVSHKSTEPAAHADVQSDAKSRRRQRKHKVRDIEPGAATDGGSSGRAPRHSHLDNTQPLTQKLVTTTTAAAAAPTADCGSVWLPPLGVRSLLDKVCITDVTANTLTVTIRECTTDEGFFSLTTLVASEPPKPTASGCTNETVAAAAASNGNEASSSPMRISASDATNDGKESTQIDRVRMAPSI